MPEQFEIKLDGTPISDDLYSSVAEFNVRNGLDTSAHAHIELWRPDLDDVGFSIGQRLSIDIGGDGADLVTVFEGPILAIGYQLGRDGSDFVVVDAYDDSYCLGRRTKVVTHVDATYADVVTAIASDAGLTPDISDLPTTMFETVQQYGTPHQFLTHILRSTGCTWHVEGTTLVVKKRVETDAAIAELSAGVGLISFRIRYSASEEVGEVSVRGWDPASQSSVVGSSSTSTASTPLSGEISPQAAIAWSRAPVDQSDAAAMATALRKWMVDSSVTGRGEAICMPSIVPGSRVTIDGVGSVFNGDYPVAEVEHGLRSGHGIVTKFIIGAAEPTTLVDLLGDGPQPSGGRFLGGVTVGIVTNLEDPETAGRVKLKLPYLSDADETGWARVVQLGAGNERGWWVHPEVNDEVVVAFENGDPRLPVVIGGVWSSANVAPATAVVDGGVLGGRSFTSGTQHLLHFDDGDAPAIVLSHGGTTTSLRFDNDNGIIVDAVDQDLELKNAEGSIKIAANGDITITGGNITVAADQAVAIEAGSDATVDGTNVTLTATSAVEATGVTAKLEGSASADVKGGMVKIN